jgi:alcohol dehydrogenase class IV
MEMETPVNVNWNYPTHIRVGAGRIAELPALCLARGIKKPLLVTDPGLAGLPMVADVLALCRAAGLETACFSQIKANPTGTNVRDGVAAFMAGGHDGVIAMGGGSGLDAGKAIALVARQTCSLWDLEDVGDNWQRADPALIAPLIAVPTTAGTGSEVGRAALIVNEAQTRKVIVFHPGMLPGSVILDPTLTVGLPAGLTAATGMDALSHSLEAYCADFYHPMAEGIAMQGVGLVKRYLPTAVRDGTDLEARQQMLVASMMGATAFQRGLGAMHALAHPLGAVFDAHHGMLNAILMPYVLKANYGAIHARIGHLAGFLGLQPDFDSFLEWVLALRAEIGIPHDLAAILDDRHSIAGIGAMAVADPSAGSNPILFSAAQYQQILKAALAGEL